MHAFMTLRGVEFHPKVSPSCLLYGIPVLVLCSRAKGVCYCSFRITIAHNIGGPCWAG